MEQRASSGPCKKNSPAQQLGWCQATRSEAESGCCIRPCPFCPVYKTGPHLCTAASVLFSLFFFSTQISLIEAEWIETPLCEIQRRVWILVPPVSPNTTALVYLALAFPRVGATRGGGCLLHPPVHAANCPFFCSFASLFFQIG